MISEEQFRIAHLPPYPLGALAHAVSTARIEGRDIIDFTQINPDFGAPAPALDKLVQSVLLPHHHRYSSSQGITKLRDAAAQLYHRRFGVEVNPESEVVATLGTKEGITHFLLALCSPGDHVVVPTPSYPIHTAGVFIAGASLIGLPLFATWEEGAAAGYQLTGESEDFFRRVELLFERSWPRPKAFVMNFPHNPTATVVTRCFFERLVEYARKLEFTLVHDFAYADICFDGYQAPSLLSIPGAKDVAIEFFSLSKSFGMPGWRIGFCVGNERCVAALKKIKSYLDFGVFQPLQIGAIAALTKASNVPLEACHEYQARRDVLADGLRELGWEHCTPRGSTFLWSRIPEKYRADGSLKLTHRLLDEANVAVSPGVGFDPEAKEFVRFALVENEKRIRLALKKIAETI